MILFKVFVCLYDEKFYVNRSFFLNIFFLNFFIYFINDNWLDKMDSSIECYNIMFFLVIGFGLVMLLFVLVFVGVMFYRW